MHDVITIGSATQDTYIQSKEFKVQRGKKGSSGMPEIAFSFGSKIEIDTLLLEVGGGATNAAATFSRFGLDVAVVSQCGDDPSGTFVFSELKKLNINTDHIHVKKGGRTGYSVIFLTKDGERTALVYRGVTGEFILDTHHLASLKTKWAYISSLAGNMTAVRSAFSLKTKGVNIAWNPGMRELQKPKSVLARFIANADILLVNQEEAQLLFGKNLCAKNIRERTQNVVVITYGSKGSDTYFGDNVYRCRVQAVRPADTTGAGDAFGSGLVAGILQKPGNIEYAITVGSANAMSVIQQIGAKHGLASPQTIPKLFKRIRIT